MFPVSLGGNQYHQYFLKLLLKVVVLYLDSMSLEILPHGLDVPVAQRSSHDGRGSSLRLCVLGHFIQEKMHSPFPDITPVCWGLEIGKRVRSALVSPLTKQPLFGLPVTVASELLCSG